MVFKIEINNNIIFPEVTVIDDVRDKEKLVELLRNTVIVAVLAVGGYCSYYQI